MRYSKLAEFGNINNVGKMTEGLAQWIAVLRKMDLNDITKILENKTVADIDFYHGQSVAAVNAKSFFTGDTAGQFTNMADFVRPAKEYALILGMRLRIGVNAAVDETVWVPGLVGVEMNGTFTFVENGVVQRNKYPLMASVSAPEDIDQGIIQFAQPIIIGDQEPFSIDVNFSNPPAANTNLLIELIGIGTIS